MTPTITEKAKGSMTKLEQCARALDEAWNVADGPTIDLPPIVFVDEELRFLVRAVLTELLTPDEGMLAAGMKCADTTLKAEWQAMINHILQEGEA